MLYLQHTIGDNLLDILFKINQADYIKTTMRNMIQILSIPIKWDYCKILTGNLIPILQFGEIDIVQLHDRWMPLPNYARAI